MISHFMKLFGVLFLAGCAMTADVSKSESSICEVHHVAMSIQEVDCLPGTSVYRTDFIAALHDQFPHHGRAHYAEDHGYLYARRIRIYVCPECTKAYDEWQGAHPTGQSQTAPINSVQPTAARFAASDG